MSNYLFRVNKLGWGSLQLFTWLEVGSFRPSTYSLVLYVVLNVRAEIAHISELRVVDFLRPSKGNHALYIALNDAAWSDPCFYQA